jgi:hypothetical protein
MPRKIPLFVGFLRRAEVRNVPNSMIYRLIVPEICAHLHQNTRFLENRAGDGTRSHGVTATAIVWPPVSWALKFWISAFDPKRYSLCRVYLLY